jgi:cytochrome P450
LFVTVPAANVDTHRGQLLAGIHTGAAFGDGEHRHPGAGVALAEAETFLDKLLRVPGLKLARAPDVGWNPLVTG